MRAQLGLTRLRPFVAIGAGIVLGVRAVLWWLWRAGAIPAFWEVYIAYNRQYAAAGLSWPTLHRGTVVVAGFLFLSLLQLRGCKGEAWAGAAKLNFAYFIAAALAIMLSGNSIRYYGPVLPACLLPLALMIDRLRVRPQLLVAGGRCFRSLSVGDWPCSATGSVPRGRVARP